MRKKAKACCGTCGKEIVLRVSWKKYCSARCRLIAWAQKQRATTDG